jgi:hypothetical protein
MKVIVISCTADDLAEPRLATRKLSQQTVADAIGRGPDATQADALTAATA